MNDPFKFAVQAFVVAGGGVDDGGVIIYYSSVVTLLPGATAWTPIASLPRTLSRARASTVGGRMRVTGGLGGGSYRTEVTIEKW